MEKNAMLTWKTFIFSLLFVVLISGIGMAKVPVLTISEISFADDTGGAALTDFANVNDTDYSTFGYAVYGGAPGSAIQVTENYTWIADWNSTDAYNFSFIFRLETNVSTGNWFVKVWNYSSLAWVSVNWGSTQIVNYSVSNISKLPEYFNDTKPLRVQVTYPGGTYAETRFFESRVEWYQNTSINISQCGVGQVPNLNVSFYDENSVTTPLNASLSAEFYIYAPGDNNTIGFFAEQNMSYAFCLTPNTTTMNLNATMIYNSGEFHQRTYYLVNTELDNETSFVRLYMLNNTKDGLVRIFLESAVGVAYANKFIRAERYYPETAESGAYQAVGMIKTAETTGDGFSYLEYNNAYYRFVVLEDNTVLKIFSNQQINKESIADEYASVALRLIDVDDEHLKYLSGTLVAYACSADNATAIVSCVIEDTSGLMASSNLTVYKYYKNITLSVCSQATTASGATLLCNVSSEGNGTYIYRATVITDNSNTYIITSEPFTIGFSMNLGSFGIELIIFFFLISSFIGLGNWRIGMLLGCVSVGAALFIMGAWELLAGALVSMVLIASIHIFRSR